MPNGIDRNFVRFIRCIGDFKEKFNHWPTKIRLDPSFILELKEVMTNEDYRKMIQRITLIPDDSNPWDGLYVAEDDEGNIRPSEIDILNWLGIEWPDYGPD